MFLVYALPYSRQQKQQCPVWVGCLGSHAYQLCHPPTHTGTGVELGSQRHPQNESSSCSWTHSYSSGVLLHIPPGKVQFQFLVSISDFELSWYHEFIHKASLHLDLGAVTVLLGCLLSSYLQQQTHAGQHVGEQVELVLQLRPQNTFSCCACIHHCSSMVLLQKVYLKTK